MDPCGKNPQSHTFQLHTGLYFTLMPNVFFFFNKNNYLASLPFCNSFIFHGGNLDEAGWGSYPS